jgi:hypothetical protein
MATHWKILKDKYGPAMKWYKCAVQILNLKDEQEVKPDPKLEGPVLVIEAMADPDHCA